MCSSDLYSVHISNTILFQLIVSYVGCGISFCQCVQLVTKTKENLGGNIGCVNVGKVIQYIWYLCAKSFNAFNILLSDYVWAFPIAFDGGNKSNQSYVDVDVCICFCLDCQVYNLHLIALPIHEHHTELNIYSLINNSRMHCAVAGKISSLGYHPMEPLT